MAGEPELLELVATASAAVCEALEATCPGAWSAGTPAAAGSPAAALAELPTPGVATTVAYTGATAGGLILLLPLEAAQRLAGVLMGGAPDAPVGAGPLTESESSTVAEAVGAMLAAAAVATSSALGPGVAAGTPETHRADADDLLADFAGAGWAASTPIEICGQACRLVHLLPGSATPARPAPAASEPREAPVAVAEVDDSDDPARSSLRQSLRTTRVRLSAEVGRTRLPVDSLVGMPPGTVIELDREADEPIDIYVNGRRFATGRLVMTETAEWAVRVERVLGQ